MKTPVNQDQPGADAAAAAADTLSIKPAPGLRVVDPATGQPLPAEGATVQAGSYWLRRLAEGDVSPI